MTTEQLDEYDTFVNSLKERYPEMYDNVYCGILISKGWFEIVDYASSVIYSNYRWRKDRRASLLNHNPHGLKIPDDVEYPKVAQIKEKFGGLRFYIDGGDEFSAGVIQMAEIWAAKTCELCGAQGKRRAGGWLRTLCDTHEVERQEQMIKAS